MRRAVPILMYHEVSRHARPNFEKYVVRPVAFAAQMRWLALARYTPVSLDALVRHRAGRAELPARPVVLTFDDGFRDCLEHAVPVLAAHRFPAVFYVVAGLVGQPSRWLEAERGLVRPLADWRAVQALETAGLECGAHTKTHPRLPSLSTAACLDELRGSKAILEDRLGVAVEDLAYPFGAYDERVRSLAIDSGYRSACSVRVGRTRPGDDVLSLPRVPVTGHDSLLDFACRLETGLTVADALRRVLRRRWRRRRSTAHAA